MLLVEVTKEYIVEVAYKLEVKKFVPRSGVVIHTNDEEAKQAEMGAGKYSFILVGGGGRYTLHSLVVLHLQVTSRGGGWGEGGAY